MNALNEDLDALLARLDEPANLERMHVAGRMCADLRTVPAVRRHIERLTDTLLVRIHDAATARVCLAGYLGSWSVQYGEVRTLMADLAAAHDRLAVALDAFEADETLATAIRAFTTE